MWFLKPDIEKLRARRDIGGLVRALGHRDESVAAAAEQAIAAIGADCMPALSATVRSLDPLLGNRDAWTTESRKNHRLTSCKRALCIMCRLDAKAAVAALPPGEQGYEPLVYLCGAGCARALGEALSQLRPEDLSRLILHWMAVAGTAGASDEQLLTTIVDLCVSRTEVIIVLDGLLDESWLPARVGWRERDAIKLHFLSMLAAARPDELLGSLTRKEFESPVLSDLDLPRLANLMKALGGQWATDGVLAVSLRHPMGVSWKENHVRCLQCIADPHRAVKLLLQKLSGESQPSEKELANINYCLGYLVGSEGVGALRFSDYDTGDLENRSFEGQLRDDLKRQNQYHRVIARSIRLAIENGDIQRDRTADEIEAAVRSRFSTLPRPHKAGR